MEFHEKLTPYKSVLTELATMGRPRHLIITINSNDHRPAHFHLTNTQDNRENRFIIRGKAPETIEDIKLYPKEELTYSKKELSILLEWMLERDKIAGQETAPHWAEMILEWNRLHNDIPVTMVGEE